MNSGIVGIVLKLAVLLFIVILVFIKTRANRRGYPLRSVKEGYYIVLSCSKIIKEDMNWYYYLLLQKARSNKDGDKRLYALPEKSITIKKINTEDVLRFGRLVVEEKTITLYI